MKKALLQIACLAMAAALSAQAPVTTPGDYTMNFNGLTEMPAGWEAVETTLGFTYGAGTYEIGSDYARSGKGLYTYQNDYAGYIVTPAVTGTVSYYARARQKSKACGVKVFTYNDGVGEEIAAAAIEWSRSNSSTSWQQVTFRLDHGTRLAFQLNNTAIDDFVAELYTVSETADLKVVDADGYPATIYNFGYILPGATVHYTMSNPGSADLDVSVSATEGFSVEPATATIPAEGSVQLTVTANATAEGTVSIVPAETSGLATVQIAVKATLRDATKMFEDFASATLPAGWELMATSGSSANESNWSFADGSAAYNYGSTWGGRYYDAAIATPLMTFAEEETIHFKAHSLKDANGYLVVETYDGSTWTATAEGALSETLTTSPTYFSATIPAGTTRVRFNGAFFAIDEVYGGTIDNTPRPKLTVEGIANGGDLSWGYSSLPAGTERTITLANDGTAPLTVTFAATAGYTLSAVETTIEAGATFELTIGTPANDGPGLLTITPAEESGLEAYTINLMSYYKVPQAIMAVDTRDIAFGKVLATVSQTVTVSNSGDAQLTVAIASDNEAFTATPTELTVAEGESQTVTITYHYAEGTYGHATAVVTLTPNHGSAVTISASATALNPDMWTEDFEDGIPSTWSNSGWTTDTPSATTVEATRMARNATASDLALITPRLQAAEGEDLTFEAYMPWDDEPVILSYSTDEGETWAEAFEPHYASEAGAYDTLTFTAPSAGYYYLRFSGRYYYIDNIAGFRLALPEHQIVIKQATLPASGNQYVPLTASVTVEEKVGAAETVSASLYVDGQPVDVQTGTELDAYGTATITFTYTPAAALTDAEAYIVVTYAGGTLQSEAVALTVAPALTLSDAMAATVEEGSYPVVDLSFMLRQGWNTLCLPFTINDLSVLGEGVEAYSFYDVTADGLLVFQRASAIYYSTPYVVYSPEARSAFRFTDVTIHSFATEAGTAEHKGVVFQGTYAPVTDGSLAGTVGLTIDGHIVRGNEKATIRGFRGYFTTPAASEDTNEQTEVKGIIIGDTTLGLRSMDSVTRTQRSSGTYDIAGRRVADTAMPAGVYIRNGRKVVR